MEEVDEETVSLYELPINIELLVDYYELPVSMELPVGQFELPVISIELPGILAIDREQLDVG